MHDSVKAYLDRYSITPQTRSFLGAAPKLFVNGQFIEGAATGTLDVIEPSTGAKIAEVLMGAKSDVDAAVAAARRAFDEGPWPRMAPNARERILHKLADLMERDARHLAEIESLDTGKAIGPCLEADILSSADLLRYMAGWATKIEGATRDISSKGFFSYTRKAPVGVVGAITPWNFPLNTLLWKFAAAMAVGCTMVVKTSEITPMSAMIFARLTQEAGIPEGVFNVVTGAGREVGASLAGHPGIDKLTFTGSTATGRAVGHAAMDNFTTLTLELGGKSPMCVFPDADLDALAEGTRWSVYFNTGQNCSAGTRLYLHKDVYDAGVKVIVDRIGRMNVCEGLNPDCDMGPMVSAAQRNSVRRYIDMGRTDGEVLMGAEQPDGPGFFVNPTLIAMRDNKHPLVQEEIFGPVLVVLPFETEDEVIGLANDTRYGLAASVWTAQNARAVRVSERLNAGSVWINCHDILDSAMPFGGVKASGFGKDMGREQLDSVLKTKAVTMAL
ncbi:aldehyde dehydrogenase family protein [Defluviimonas salinarum]|uniref:Aldehyde dehydrogenase family protein n=1 Tax=Defluviimonas salinarum TaxID=2992147 RepID=A0ABT3J8B6_9RHOB|nr:aldehyde dehydrogenase family protein [Defluviimonas salinarum]MCW3783624.1 aldehyde dehydrogenase family protein [Defluviimonas salinarum]